jgi:hypothetical protein
VDHVITALDVPIQHLQGFIARHDELFMHLHLHIRPREQMAQAIPVAEEFSTDGGEENLDAGKSKLKGYGILTDIFRLSESKEWGSWQLCFKACFLR